MLRASRSSSVASHVIWNIRVVFLIAVTYSIARNSTSSRIENYCVVCARVEVPRDFRQILAATLRLTELPDFLQTPGLTLIASTAMILAIAIFTLGFLARRAKWIRRVSHAITLCFCYWASAARASPSAYVWSVNAAGPAGSATVATSTIIHTHLIYDSIVIVL